ncbi:radical SAM protein, partial [Rhodospirillum rubrum]
MTVPAYPSRQPAAGGVSSCGGAGGGCGDRTACDGGDGGRATAPVVALRGRHPCFDPAPQAHARAGRLHLPVSPACNITCQFCARDFNASDRRPGVARRLLKPEQALDVVRRALRLCPEISVVGIAGPGDTLATNHAIDTFALIHADFPTLINCLSTNGLRLPDRAKELAAVGVQTLTVTVNAVAPEIQAVISPVIADRGKRLEGIEAARVLIANQLEGIAKAVALGMVVKVNCVLIPGVNDDHIGAVAQKVAAAGASLFNIIALIPTHN